MYRVVISEECTSYEGKEQTKSWQIVDQADTTDKTTMAGILRSIANRMDPPSPQRGY
jgi:hypothetical protein